MVIYLALMEISDSKYREHTDYMDSRYMNYVEELNVWRGIYGFTNKKKLFNKFMKMHPILISHKIDIFEDEYEEYMKKYKDAIIEKRWIGVNKEYSVRIPLTFREHTNSTEFASETYYSDFAISACINPDIFTREVNKWLIDIGYKTCWADMFGSEEDMDCVYYDQSFGIGTTPGYSQLGIFCLIYKEIIDSEVLYLLISEEVSSNHVKEIEEGF